MSASNDQSNPLGHIRFPNVKLSELCKNIEQATKMSSSIVEKMATYHATQFDYGQLARITDRFSEAIRRGQEQATRFNEMLAGSTTGMEQALKAIHSVVDSGNFEKALSSACSVTERISDIVLQMPNITDTFSVFHDRIIVSDLIMSGSFMPPAGEYRHLDPPLPLEQIILTDLVLEPVGVSHPSAPSTESQEAPDTATPQQESPAAPIFLQRLDLEMQEKIFDMLPPEADLIDETIALFEPRKAGIFILTQYGWVKEENGVGTQTIRLIQYLRRIGKRPGQPCASLTELAGVLAKRAASMRTARSSVSNRIIRIEEICMERNLKPILIQSAGLWRINPQLTHWDEVKTKPWVHN